ncbi:MAG: hypothetical protein WKF60_02545 [Ilumatobacter sp.]
MNDGVRKLTAYEKQVFDEIEVRLRDDIKPASRNRRATVASSVGIVVGVMLGATGLIANNIAVAFAGFVAVVIGVERFTLTSAMRRWCQRVEQRTGLSSSEAPDP